MYIERALAEDIRMVESWKGDAEGMLVFVRLQTPPHTSVYNLEIVDRSLLCFRCGITRIIRPYYSSQPAGHLVILSRTHLSAVTHPTERNPTSHTLILERSHRTVRSAYIGRLG